MVASHACCETTSSCKVHSPRILLMMAVIFSAPLFIWLSLTPCLTTPGTGTPGLQQAAMTEAQCKGVACKPGRRQRTSFCEFCYMNFEGRFSLTGP